MKKTAFKAWGLLFLLLLFGACTNVGDFSTSVGQCYSGDIVDAEFVRQGFDAGVELSLSLDVKALENSEKGGAITTNDSKFVQTSFYQMEQLFHDTLSLLQFPGGRVQNYLTHAQLSDGSIATVVISLMENEDVEVRILRPGSDIDAALFGVFHLELTDKCE